MKNTKIYLDTANINQIKKFKDKNFICGFTTNPSLVAKNKVKNYLSFCKQITSFTNKPVSFEVFGDDFKKMKQEAEILKGISKNTYVKIPIVNSKGESSVKLIKELLDQKTKLNITAIFCESQLKKLSKIITKRDNVILSIFCGRIMDTGKSVNKISNYANKLFKKYNKTKILWASTREIYNLNMAKNLDYDLITITPEILDKLKYKNFKLMKFSILTVKGFVSDAKSSGLKIV